MLKKEYDYFKSHFDELFSQYEGEYIVIKNEAVIGHYTSFDEAYRETGQKEKIGTFLIQHCVVQDPGPTAHYAWCNVSFEQAVN